MLKEWSLLSLTCINKLVVLLDIVYLLPAVAPEITANAGGLVRVPLDGTLELSCSFQSVPPPDNITWIHNNTQLSTLQSQVLRIVQLTVVYIADHVCVVCVCRVFNVAGDRSVNRWRLATDCCRHTASDSSMFCERQKRRHHKQLQTM